MNRSFGLVLAALGTLAGLLPSASAAEPPVAMSSSPGDDWQFGAFIYLYYPDIGSKVDFPNGGSSDIAVDASKVYSNLRFGMLGSFEARKGDYGLFTDLIYMDAGTFRSGFRDLSIGRVGLPADVSASLNFDFKTTIWTLAATLRLVKAEDASLDVFAGARFLELREQIDWTLNGNIGQFPLAGQAGTQSTMNHSWDGIVGLKGRLALGHDLRWFIPYYGDIGTGDADVTWQASAGLGYAFRWGEVIGAWRYLDYQFKSGSTVDSMNLSGPLLGVALHW